MHELSKLTVAQAEASRDVTEPGEKFTFGF